MYMTYDTNQQSLFKYVFNWPKTRCNPPYPLWLVRVSDMKVIPISPDAKDVKYCAVSYPWVYSGDIVVDSDNKDSAENCQKYINKIKYNDRGQHNLITYSPDPSTGKTRAIMKKVKFEDILQQLCKDFGVEYLWYDKLCTNPFADIEEKKYELSNIHHRYASSQFTIALIPEMEYNPKNDEFDERLKTTDDKNTLTFFNNNLEDCLRVLQQSEWYKRVWTYIEAIHSKTILFVGKNVHFTSDQIRALNSNRRIDDMLSVEGTRKRTYLYQLIDTFEEMYTFPVSASCLLRRIQERESTFEQDKIFALVNVLNNHKYMCIGYQFDYKCPIVDALVKLYGILASNDLSLMCFGQPRSINRNTVSHNKLLPSWTGARGIHALNIIKPKTQEGMRCSNINNGIMNINCECVKVYPIRHIVDEKAKPAKQNRYAEEEGRDKKDVILNIENLFDLRITHYIEQTNVICEGKINEDEATALGDASKLDPRNTELFVAYMSLVCDDVESDDEYLVLNIPFDTKRGFACPVVIDRKDGHYRSIGVIFFTLYDWNFNALVNDPLVRFGTKIRLNLKIV